jgi:hypothetical protein
MTIADRKAHLTRSRDGARRHPQPMLAGEPSDLPGRQLWMVGGVAVLMPKPLPGAPASIRRWYLQHIVANATGECMRCGTLAADRLDGDPLDRARLAHDDDCPLLMVEAEAERLLDPRARLLRQLLATIGPDQGQAA